MCPGVVSTGLFEGATALRLTRILTPDRVADAVVSGVLRDRSYVRTPWLVKVAPVLRGVLPHRAFNSVNEFFGGTTTMDSWTGREHGSTGTGRRAGEGGWNVRAAVRRATPSGGWDHSPALRRRPRSSCGI